MAKIKRKGRSSGFYLSITAILIASCIININLSDSTNVSALIQEGARMLSGEILYTEIPEINPPASVLLYAPAVWLENNHGLKAELAMLGLMIFLIILSIEISAKVLYENELIKSQERWIIFSYLVTCLIAWDSFAEREHIALMLILPILSIVACRLKGNKISTLGTIPFGLMAGVAVCIKPHFAAAILIPQAYVALRNKSFSPILCSENLTLTLVLLIYSLVFITFFGQYFITILPQALEVYIPARTPIQYLILAISPLLLTFGFIIILTWKLRPQGISIINTVFLLSSLGFLISHLVQGKVWSYHYYPMAALLLLVAFDTVATKAMVSNQDAPDFKRQIGACFLLLASLFFIEILLFKPTPQDSLELVEVIKKNYSSPRIIAISGDLGIINPLIRRVNGRFASDSGCCLISENVHYILKSSPNMAPEKKYLLERWELREREALIRDFVKWNPDILLVDTRTWLVDWGNWIKNDRRLLELVCQYESVASTESVALLFRRKTPSNKAPCRLPSQIEKVDS